MIEQSLVEETRDYGMAKEVAEILHENYPGHLWAVSVQSGIVNIKNLFISQTYGMALHYENMGDATERKAKVIRSGGEFLERAHMRRRSFEGSTKILEGSKEGRR